MLCILYTPPGNSPLFEGSHVFEIGLWSEIHFACSEGGYVRDTGKEYGNYYLGFSSEALNEGFRSRILKLGKHPSPNETSEKET